MSTDYQLNIITNAQYQEIAQKDASASIPTHLMYNPEYPKGKIHLYPIPDTAYQLGITQKLPLSQVSALTTEIDLPEGYEIAIVYNLAILLASEYGKSIPPEVYKIAVDSKATLKRINTTIPILKHDYGCQHSGYDINSDTYR
jgi:hypothetical protein